MMTEKFSEEPLEKLQSKIGDTPLINLGNEIEGKLESRNPAGSVKDRAAFYIVKNALLSGELKTGGTVVEATSGNTGIGLAYVCKELGLKFIAVMPSSMSKERIALMEHYGAKVTLTDAKEGMSGAVKTAREYMANGAYLANQFGNKSGIQAHYETTAPEIFAARPNTKWIVCGIGSGGTYFGIKNYIRDNKIDCKVVAVEPYESPLISEGRASSHKIQGIGANFVPELVEKDRIDKIITVKGDDAVAAVKEIYRISGEKCGISSAAAYLAALEMRKDGKSNIIAILPDGGDRYDQKLYE